MVGRWGGRIRQRERKRVKVKRKNGSLMECEKKTDVKENRKWNKREKWSEGSDL